MLGSYWLPGRPRFTSGLGHLKYFLKGSLRPSCANAGTGDEVQRDVLRCLSVLTSFARTQKKRPLSVASISSIRALFTQAVSF